MVSAQLQPPSRPPPRRRRKAHEVPKGTPIPPELRAFDPLAPSSPRGPSSWFEAVVLILGAALVHGAVVTALYAANAIVPRRALDVAKDEIVEMKIVEPPPPVEPEPLVK